MGKHSDRKQSWAITARDFASAVVTWNRKPQGRHGGAGDDEQLTATGVLRTVRRRPMVAAIALPAAATAGIVASTLAMGPDHSGTVSAEATAQTSTPLPAEESTSASAEEIEAQQEEEYEDYVSSLKDDDRYGQGGDSSLEKVPEPTPSSPPVSSADGSAPADDGESEEAASGSGEVSGEPCSVSSEIESGLTPNGVAAYRAVCANFSEVSSYGGKRNDPGSDHNTGRAVDIMITGATGDQIKDFLIANKDELNVDYVIWEQQIYASYTGWSGRGMEDRGSATANHFDHVHVSVK